MSRRAVTSGLTLGAALATLVLTAGPALADRNPIGQYEGDEPGKGIGPAATILLFVVLPVVTVLALAAITLLPGALRAHRYRPGKAWDAAPVWFAGPVEPAAAVASAEVGDVVRGGASGNW